MSLLRAIIGVQIRPCAVTLKRFLSTAPAIDYDALLKWKEQHRELTFTDTLRREHLADLFVTLPTRDGTRANMPEHHYHWSVREPPPIRAPLPYGHHLVFFHPRSVERDLRWDGTDADFCPPEPFTRRMWAAGEMSWATKPDHGLLVGEPALAVAEVTDVLLKGFNNDDGGKGDNLMVFVEQSISYKRSERDPIAIHEKRTHVYLPAARERRTIKRVTGLPDPDFTFEYLPTPTTLFRFSALTFNAHFIHLDKHYAIDIEGYAERLVHGPLTALMLLEVTTMQQTVKAVKHFKYRAQNPLVVKQPVVIKGAWADKERTVAHVWAESGVDRTVGMTGQITFLG